MLKQTIATGLRMLLLMIMLTGVVYPLSVTVIAQVFFAQQANGSLLTRDNQIIGSSLIGQQTDDPRYFWWRPSAVGYMEGTTFDHPVSSGATNYGWTNQTLADAAVQRANDFRSENGLAKDAPVPADMVSASGSGLDPHISPDAARLQIDRVATARGLNPEQVTILVEKYIEAPQLGFLGEPRVNVLQLNLALDELK